jgi:hypothetical protein
MREFSYDFELTPLSRGFDRGNFGNAYENEDYDTWRPQQKIPVEYVGSPSACSAYEAGMFLGFYSSYEDHEIPDHHRDHVIAVHGLNLDMLKACGIATRES